jgi:hypothetical protein
VSTLTIAIGNSDDGLSQKEWAAFWRATHDTVLAHAARVYGTFLSASHAPYQNACWLIETASDPPLSPRFREALASLARDFRQESIAVAVGSTTLVTPPHPAPAP